jgi:hypothetical protein
MFRTRVKEVNSWHREYSRKVAFSACILRKQLKPVNYGRPQPEKKLDSPEPSQVIYVRFRSGSNDYAVVSFLAFMPDSAHRPLFLSIQLGSLIEEERIQSLSCAVSSFGKVCIFHAADLDTNPYLAQRFLWCR